MDEKEQQGIDSLLSRLTPAEREEIQKAAKKMQQEKLEMLTAVQLCFQLVEKGDLNGLMKALEQEGTELNAETRDGEGRTMLHLASFQGHTEIAKYLINEKNANVKATDEFQRTPLHCVAFGNHEKIAKMLVLKGANVDASDEKSCTPLHWACKKGSDDLIKLLVDRGANLNAQTKEGWTPLHLACEGGHTEAAMLLCSRGADINVKDEIGASPLRVAVNGGHALLVKYFLDRNAEGIDETVKNTTLIDLACLRGSMEVTELLLNHGAKATARMMKKAIKDSDVRLLKMCVEQSMEGIPQTGVYLACKKGQTDLVIQMVEQRGFKVDLTCFKLAHESGEKELKEWIRKQAQGVYGNKCLNCNKEESEVKLLRCGKCKIVKFCGSVCQKSSFQEHKIYCFA